MTIRRMVWVPVLSGAMRSRQPAVGLRGGRNPLDAVEQLPVGAQHRLGLGDERVLVGSREPRLDQRPLGRRVLVVELGVQVEVRRRRAAARSRRSSRSPRRLVSAIAGWPDSIAYSATSEDSSSRSPSPAQARGARDGLGFGAASRVAADRAR